MLLKYSRMAHYSVSSQTSDGGTHAEGMGDGHTIMNLVKSALGAGSLSLPRAFLLVRHPANLIVSVFNLSISLRVGCG